MTRVRVEPSPFDQGWRKNDAFTHSATLPTKVNLVTLRKQFNLGLGKPPPFSGNSNLENIFRVSKTFYRDIFFVFLENFSTRIRKMRRYFQNYISILAIANCQNGLDASPSSKQLLESKTGVGFDPTLLLICKVNCLKIM